MDQEASMPDSELIGLTLADRYEILSLIGHGGMGSVYKAKHVLLDKYVAVKILQLRHLTDPSNFERFQQEAKAVSSLMHSNVVSVIDYGISDQGAPYLVMDYFEGITLAGLIRRENHIEENRAVKIFIQIARALNHIHSRGVLHRDLKPGNIILLNNESETDLVKIMDFGISRRSEFKEDVDEITLKGQLVGSPLYMSPEQCVGRDLDARSDLYSFGCLMYETLIGLPPLAGDTPMQTVFRRASEQPLSFKEMRPAVHVSCDLESIVLKSLERRPEDRYQNAKDLANDLELFSVGEELKTALAQNKGDGPEHASNVKAIANAKEAVGFGRLTKILSPAPYILLLSIVCLLGIVFVSFFTATGSIAVGKVDLFLESNLLPPTDERILQGVNRLADTCMENQHYQDAEPLYKRAVALTEKRFDIYSPEAVLAHCKHVQACLKKNGLLPATAVFKSDVEPVFPRVLKELLSDGKNLEAANLGTTVLDLQKLLHMEPCLDARGLYDLASCYERLHMFDMAGPLYEKALSLARLNNGARSPLVGTILIGIGDLHSWTGKSDQAVAEYKEALTMIKSASESIGCQFHMANAECTRGQTKAAEGLYKSVIAEEQAIGYQDTKITRQALLNYAELLRRNQRISEAQKMEERAKQFPEVQEIK